MLRGVISSSVKAFLVNTKASVSDFPGDLNL